MTRKSPSETVPSAAFTSALPWRPFRREVAFVSTHLPGCPGLRCGATKPVKQVRDFNTAHSPGSPTEGRVCLQEPTLCENMTSTRIELAFNKIARMNDASDLAELLFPGNRNQQHAFLAIWFALKWASPGLVPNLNDATQEHGISRRTLERVRAKLRRLGLIDHVSRFNARHGYREGWVLSPRFANSLKQLADKVTMLASAQPGARDKDVLLLHLAQARRAAATHTHQPISGLAAGSAQRGATP